MKIRAVIVDDEPLARSRIINLLSDHPDIQIIGQCRNGIEAISLIKKRLPELIFLDIQMPDMNGFQVLAELDLSYLPIIIFATAYDKYALKAFDVHAVDYLLKPFDRERFEESLSQARDKMKLKKASEFNDRLLSLVNNYQQDHQDYLQSFCLKIDGRLRNIATDDIYWIEAEGNYISLNLEQRNFLYRATMNAVEKQLDPQIFLRIHRSFILNLKLVDRVSYLQNSEYAFKLKNSVTLTSSRSFKDRIVEALDHSTFLE